MTTGRVNVHRAQSIAIDHAHLMQERGAFA
jgi:hypothetical protein